MIRFCSTASSLRVSHVLQHLAIATLRADVLSEKVFRLSTVGSTNVMLLSAHACPWWRRAD